VPNVCLRELCKIDAIEGGNPNSTRCGNQDGLAGLTGRYTVDKARCTGCMNCYDNIRCPTISMKSYITPRIGATLDVVGVRYEPPPGFKPPFLQVARHITIEIWGRDLNGTIHKSIRLDMGASGPTRIPRDFDPHLPRGGINFIDALHITVHPRTATVIGRPWFSGRLTPEKHVIDLHEILGGFPVRSYGGTLKLLGGLFVDYSLINIDYY